MSKATYSSLADIVAILHGAYAGFIVIALLLILMGYVAQWNWVRNFKFRMLHLTMIAIVVAESWLGILCPLTTLEISLRDKAGEGFDATPIAQFTHSFLFYDASWWVFTASYTICGLMIFLSLFLVPPHRISKHSLQN